MTEFTDREAVLEAEMAQRGVERRQSATARLRERGRQSLTVAGHSVVRAAMSRVVPALTEWLAAQEREQPTRRLASYGPVLAVPPAQACLLALRTCLDAACRGDTWNACCHAVASAMDAEREARWVAEQHPGSWAAIRRNARAIPERAPSRLRRSTRRFARDKGFVRWSMRERLGAGALMCQVVLEHAGLVGLESMPMGRRRSRHVLRLLPEVEHWIYEADRRDSLLEPLYMPMLDVPGDWARGQAGGYSTGLVARQHLVKNRSRTTQELVADAEMPDVYRAVNALQRTAWEINPTVLEVARTLWESGERWAGVGGAEDVPLPPRPPGGQPVTAEWMRERFLVRRENLRRAGTRGEAARILWLAGRLQPEGQFHYPQQLDFRGRVYPVPQFLQPQGPDLARGLLRFADGAWIEWSDWFWVHGANCFGHDKLPLRDRIAWTLLRRDDIRRVHADPLDCRWWQEAEEPWQFLAWCLEAGELLETGRVLTRIPCYIDGSNNGLQILSMLLRDPVGGSATNCTPGDRRDVYQDVADAVTSALREADDDCARGWLAWFEGGRMPRAAAKRSVMTLPYGCTRWSVRQYVVEWYEEEVRLGRPAAWPTAGEAFGRLTELANLLWTAIEGTLGRALEAMAWMRQLTDLVVRAGAQPLWVAPTGFPVRSSYPQWRSQVIRTKLGEKVRWVRHRRDAGRPNKRRHRNGLPPNFVHSLDAAALARVVSRFGDRPVSTIHDSFGALAPDVAELGRLVREVYAEMFQPDLLVNLRDQLARAAGGRVDFPQPPTRGSLDPMGILNSEYAFS